MAFRRYRNRRYSTRKSIAVRKPRRVLRRNYKKLRRIPRGVSTQSNIPRMQKIRYVQDVSLSCVSGAPAYYQFRANGVYDPDYTGGGHQPMRFDQMAAFYADYVVIGSKITIRHVGAGAGNPPIKLIAYLNDTNISSLLYVNDLIEQGRCKYIITGEGVQRRQDKLTLGFSAKKFFGLTNVKDNTDRIGAPVTNNPTDAAIFVVAAQPMDGSSSLAGINLSITIDYLVWFNQPLQLSTS